MYCIAIKGEIIKETTDQLLLQI